MGYGSPPPPGYGPQPGHGQQPGGGQGRQQGSGQPVYGTPGPPPPPPSPSSPRPGYAQPPPPGGYAQQPQYSPPQAASSFQSGPATYQERNWAVMGYIGQFIASFFAPVVVLTLKGRSPFVRKHAAQGVNVSIAAIVMWVVCGLFSYVVPNAVAVALAFTGVSIFFLVRAARAANRGEFARIPIVVAWPILK